MAMLNAVSHIMRVVKDFIQCKILQFNKVHKCITYSDIPKQIEISGNIHLKRYGITKTTPEKT